MTGAATAEGARAMMLAAGIGRALLAPVVAAVVAIVVSASRC